MTDVKVSLTIGLPGGTMYSKQLCFKNSESVDKNGRRIVTETPIEGMTDQGTFILRSLDKKTGKWSDQRFTYHTRKCIPAKQVMRLTTDCYEYLISNSVPGWFRVSGKKGTQLASLWAQVPKKEKLKLGLERIAASLNGVVLDYQILDD